VSEGTSNEKLCVECGERPRSGQYQLCKDCRNVRRRERYATDPEYRERVLQQNAGDMTVVKACDYPCNMGRMCLKCAMGESYDGTDPGRKPWV
jgi:hypothetical protein